MFQNPSSYKKQDKICSISNFSSSQNSGYLNEQQISAQARNFASQLKRHEQKRFHKPVFIITQDLTAKHINALTQILQKNRVPIQYQHQTQSLGQQLNTRFFVVVDNKNGTLKLGKQFNSSLMTIVGYPKIGNNKQNIYCQYGEDVFLQYKEFVNAKTSPGLAEDEYQVQGSQMKGKGQESLLKSGSNGFSVLRSDLSGLKLKSISKYDRKKREVSQKDFSYNKQNMASIRDVYTQLQPIHNLYFLESLQNQTFNNFIGRYYHEIKLNTAKVIEQTIFYHRADTDLIRKLNQSNPSFSGKSIKRINSFTANPNKLHYVIISWEAALKLATRVNCEFFAFKDKIRLIVAMLNRQNIPNQDNEKLQKQMLLVKNIIHSNIFHSLVCSQEECEKALNTIGFRFSNEVPQIKVTPNECKSILTKSHKKLNGTQNKLKPSKEVLTEEDTTIFCPKLKNSVQINQQQNMNHTLRSEDFLIKPERQNNLMVNTLQFVTPQSAISASSNRSKIIIPPISSMLSPQKSAVSSNGSKPKIIKVLKKQPSSFTPAKQQQRGKCISQVNSEYCINKNKSIVQKMQQKIALSNSRPKLNSAQFGSNKSIDNHFMSQQKMHLNKIHPHDSHISARSSDKSLSKSNQFSNQNQNNRLTGKRFQSDYQCSASPETKNIKKMKLNSQTEEPFIVRNSQLASTNNQETQSSYKNIRKLKKQTKPTNPMPVNDYYFGSTSTSNKRQEQQNSPAHNQNLINGLIHVEYNEFIGLIVNEFKKNCPSSIIHKDSHKPFYLSCEYSRQVKKLSRNAKHRCILPSLTDLQGLKQIFKYYSNLAYEDDELQFCSTFEDKRSIHHQNMQNTGKFTASPNSGDPDSQILLFFTIVSQNQVDDQIFQRIDWIAQKLPKHEVIKCVVEQNMSDNQMKEKANQIYTQMVAYFTELKEEHGGRFVQTV